MSSFYEIRIKHLRAERDRLRLALAAPGTIVELHVPTDAPAPT